MSAVWAKWEGQVINGMFPLRRYLGGSDHSGVFLTESKARNLPNAALKLVPAIPTLTEAQLSHWTLAAALSHPHLIQLLEVGRCRLGDLQFLFVVMEYAEQTLSQILPQRALTPDEVREMLHPILAALAFLHRKHLVQGRLKPSNILVVGDQLKLASDTIRPAGESTASLSQPSEYDPPEASDGGFSAAGDTWSLGVTVVEALTQHSPAWLDKRFDTVSLPATFPSMFTGVVRQCLNRDPADRPTVGDLQAQLKPVPPAPAGSAQPAVSRPEPLVREAPGGSPPPEKPPRRRLFIAALAGVLVVALAVWAGLRSSLTPQNPETSRSAPPEVSAPSSGVPSADSMLESSQPMSRPVDKPARLPASDAPSVLHEEIPDVPRSARNTIHGHIKVAVRVTVDGSGSVIHAALENPGSSKYFARLATEAARKWKFTPADNQVSRKWLLRFDFTRAGALGRASSPQS
jgi:TonB family protein